MSKFIPRPLLTIKKSDSGLPSNWLVSTTKFKKISPISPVSNLPIKQVKRRPGRLKQYGDKGYKPATGSGTSN